MVKRVTPPEAAELLGDGWVYLDVRSIPEFEQGHPTGAVNIPLLHAQAGRMVANPDFQAVVAANYPPDAKLVVGCKVGGRSLKAATLLEAAGYTSVVDMRGGYDGERDAMGRLSLAGWAESKLPCETACAPDKSYAALKSRAGQEGVAGRQR